MIRKGSVLIVVVLVSASWLATDLGGESSRTQGVAATSQQRHVRLTSRSGSSRVATLEGVGCTEAICSRVAVRTRPVSGDEAGVTFVNFDVTAAVRPHRPGVVTVDFVDGSSRQVVIPTENRVLYLFNDSHHREKLNMGELSAIEFLR